MTHAWTARTSDGVGEEYLYDRTGGTRGPGIKSFFHWNIDNLEVLADTFDPQFEVTLAKAGDNTQQGVFTGNPGPRGSRRRRADRVRCCTCGKTFSRTNRSTRLNPHRAPNGLPCSNRSSYRA